ncbi:hypothetical protein BHM03_00051399 [Ensete ventricosum]|nr:hypothetical protein BHM03_00051399 [Ensete ventricosum]
MRLCRRRQEWLSMLGCRSFNPNPKWLSDRGWIASFGSESDPIGVQSCVPSTIDQGQFRQYKYRHCHDEGGRGGESHKGERMTWHGRESATLRREKKEGGFCRHPPSAPGHFQLGFPRSFGVFPVQSTRDGERTRGGKRKASPILVQKAGILLGAPKKNIVLQLLVLFWEMSPGSYITCLLTLFVVLVLVPNTHELQSSQAWSLLRIQRLLNYPSVLSNWSTNTDFCNADPNPYLTVVCYEDNITQLHISGSENSPPLPRSFSIDSFFTTLTRLPNLKVLSLTSLGLWGPLPAKISRLSSLEIVNMSSNYLYGAISQQVFSLNNLQTLILDHNMFSGRVPDAISKLHLLAVLSLRNNTFHGRLPKSFSVLESLRVLVLSSNSLSGDLPDLSCLTNLQVLNLENNYLGPNFPHLGRKVASIMLSKNMFGGGLPANLSSYYLLEQMDVSFNRFVGPFLPSLLSLPSIRYLNIAGNRFTGMLFQNMTCNDDLMFVDLSSNLLSGKLPTCLTSDPKNKVVLYSSNCLRIKDHSQHPSSFCQTQALAVGILPHKQMRVSGGITAMAVGAAGGIVISVFLVGLAVFFVLRKINIKRAMKKPPRRIVEHASNGYPPKLLADASIPSVPASLILFILF